MTPRIVKTLYFIELMKRSARLTKSLRFCLLGQVWNEPFWTFSVYTSSLNWTLETIFVHLLLPEMQRLGQNMLIEGQAFFFVNQIYRGVGLIRTMEIVKKSSELARPCGFKSFYLKNEFLLRIASSLSYTRPNVAYKYSLTQFLYTKVQFMWPKLEKK